MPPVKELPKSSKEALSVGKATAKTNAQNARLYLKVALTRKMKKKEGMSGWRWIGCDEIDCQYWGNAKCLGIVAKGFSRRSIESIPFMCPRHKQ